MGHLRCPARMPSSRRGTSRSIVRSRGSQSADDRTNRSGFRCACLREIMPADMVYIDETVVYGNVVQTHLPWTRPQSFFRTPAGLGQALGVKFAAPARPAVALASDGSFLYNPALSAFSASKANKLPLLVIVFNNREYRSMRRNHLALYPNGVAKEPESITVTGSIHRFTLSLLAHSTVLEACRRCDRIARCD